MVDITRALSHLFYLFSRNSIANNGWFGSTQIINKQIAILFLWLCLVKDYYIIKKSVYIELFTVKKGLDTF